MANLAKAAAQAQPTTFHKLLRALSCGGILGRVYTQNIDDLELRSGLTTIGREPNCVQLHGSVMKVRCTLCGFTEHVYHHFSTLSLGKLPACPKCETWIQGRKSEGKRISSRGGLLRPAIILYGELHPNGDHIADMQYLDRSRADNLLVVGTSLKTFGSSSLIKDISTGIRERGKGKVYYMDLEKPTTSQVDMFKFDHIIQADCQYFANHMLDRLGTPEHLGSADYLKGKAGLAYLVEAGRTREDMRPSWAWV
jgi:NAD-dependent SIR2 family protein deacetylase